jgi:hypothetical protein
MKAPKGRTVVNVSEKKAEQLYTIFGYSYLDTPESPAEATTDAARGNPAASNQTQSGSEPATPTPAPKRRGRPRKEANG